MLRKGTLEDCKAVYGLICDMECKELPFDRFSEIYQRQISGSNYYCLVCEHENDVIGFVSQSLPNLKRLWMYSN